MGSQNGTPLFGQNHNNGGSVEMKRGQKRGPEMGQYTGVQKGGQNDPLLLAQSPKMTV